jgi:hypothetical protein
MTTTAISAQGSTLSIGASAGSAQTISAVTAGYPTIIHATGIAAGDVVTIAGTSGAAGLNATFVAKNVNASTFSVDFDSTGDTVTVSSATATPVTWTPIVNFKSFTGFDGQPTEIDASNLSSSAKEFVMGLVDSGQMSIVVDLDNSNTAHQAMRTSHAASNSKPYKLVLPDGHTASFTAYVKKFPLDGGVDKILQASIDLRITGAISWT